MQNICNQCSAKFNVSDEDVIFYEKVSPIFKEKKYSIPPPTLCPECRQQRRISWRNERNLYKRKCSLCSSEHISIYSPDKNFNVLCSDCWWSDKWSGLDYGRNFNFSRPFFEQFQELINVAGLISFFGRNNQNSEYVNQETDDKNCYMNAGGHYNEDCYYCTYSLWGKNNVDCYWVNKCELCYECNHCEHCNNCFGLKDCNQCSDCMFCTECTGCNNCFGSYGLKHKEYYFLNEKLDKDKYLKRIEDIKGSYERLKLARDRSKENLLKFPHRNAVIIHCENSIGDYLMDCKNVENGYLFEKGHDLKNAFIGLDVKNSMDISSYGWGEVCYEIGSSIENNFSCFMTSTISNRDCFYNFVCNYSDHLFGCVGLNKQSYCILNKKYQKAEYEELVPKIIEHMKHSNEWGEFLPTNLSPWGYNETVASEYFPLGREEVLKSGWKWKEDDPKEFEKQIYEIPDNIKDVEDEIVNSVLSCEVTCRNYRVTKQELAFYRRLNISIPRRHPQTRHLDRLILQNPWKTCERKCGKCEKEFQTTYSPKRPETVYCEECYLKEVY
ncbi:hypothetical protein KKC44_06415 [Patescibacteria group bacterium]|nr:hypothetical protein [Patescibacteria group bacterium]